MCFTPWAWKAVTIMPSTLHPAAPPRQLTGSEISVWKGRPFGMTRQQDGSHQHPPGSPHPFCPSPMFHPNHSPSCSNKVILLSLSPDLSVCNFCLLDPNPCSLLVQVSAVFPPSPPPPHSFLAVTKALSASDSAFLLSQRTPPMWTEAC